MKDRDGGDSGRGLGKGGREELDGGVALAPAISNHSSNNGKNSKRHIEN